MTLADTGASLYALLRDSKSPRLGRLSLAKPDCVHLPVVARLLEPAVVDVLRDAVIRGPKSTFHHRLVVTATLFEEIR